MNTKHYNLTVMLGSAVLTLGFLLISGIVNVESRFIVAFTISSLCFAIAEFLNTLKLTERLTEYIYLFGIALIIVFPFYNFEVNQQITNGITLMGLGFAIVTVGLKERERFITSTEENDKVSG